MFDLFSTSHLLIIAIAILVFIGPKDLPRFMRAAGQWGRKLRGLVAEFRSGFEDMSRQAELDELRKELGNLRAERAPDVAPRQAQAPAETTP